MKGRTWELALWICAIAVLPAQCIDPWKTEYLSNYKLEFFKSAVNFNTAKTFCEGRSAILIRMDNEQVRNKVYSTITSVTNVEYFWIGATGTLYQWRWLGETTNADTSFIKWYEKQPDNHDGSDTNLVVRKRDGKYGDVKNDFHKAGTICQKPLVTSFGGYRLEVFFHSLRFPEAKTECQKRGGMLFEPRSKDMNDAVKGLLRSGYGHFIGLKNILGEWKWESDNSNLTYQNWAKNPGSDKDNTCGLLVGLGGSWNKVSCTNPTRNYACQTHICNTTSEVCENGGICSKIDSQPYYKCNCEDGFYGPTCSNTFCESNRDWCGIGGNCSSELGSSSWNCNCQPGYFGDKCQDQYCKKNTKTCKPAGTCSSTLVSPFYTCKCDEKYEGRDCKTGATIFNGYRLETIFWGKTFNKAKYECTKKGQILFEPRTETMNNAIKTLLRSNYGNFIGLQYRNNPSSKRWQWQWESNKGEATYTNWNVDFPNNNRTNRCVLIRGTSGKWENVVCENRNYPRNYACQKHLICDVTTTPCLNGGKCRPAEVAPYYNCICTKGYYKKNCTDFLDVTSPEKVLSVAGNHQVLLINATIVATERRVNVHLHKNTDLKKPIQNDTIDANTTAQFQFYRVNKSIAGTYTIFAKTISNEYTAKVSFKITVHEKTKIEVINPKFIFSPITNGSKRVECRAIGTPTPSVSWYRGISEMKRGSRSTGIYQTKEKPMAYLHITNALLSDNGTYTCKAENRVGPNKITITANASAFLSVFGKPTIERTFPEQCSVNGSVEILWVSNNQTNGIEHKLTVKSLNSTIRNNVHEVTQMTANNTVVFGNLLPSTKYRLQILVCPDQCISKLNATTEFTTGVGLPGELYNPILKSNNDSSVCLVTWDRPKTTQTDKILHVEVTWESIMVFNPDNSADAKIIVDTLNVPYPFQQSNISTLPNRNYSVSLRAVTCAGHGPGVTANGTCNSEPGAPAKVEKPTINDGTDIISLTLPDESNGRISCTFVVVTEGDTSGMSGTINEEILRKASFTVQNTKPQPGESYIAIAIPRANFTDSTFDTKFGDNTESYCDPADLGNTMQTSRKKRDTNDAGLWGKNWPLRERSIYSYFTVTTTPTSSGHVHYARSEAASYENNKPFQYTLMIILIVVAVTVVGVAIAFGYYRKRYHGKGDIAEKSEEEVTYENIVLKEMDSETTIPLSKLLNVYKAMKADSSLKFREEFQELKLQAKSVMTPATVAEREEMMMKNRYKNILPFDETRVLLQGGGFESYINACHIKGKEKNFIATQGPLPITVGDFWKMIVEYKVKVIVMLAKCKEAGKDKCAKYWPNIGEDAQRGNLKIKNTDEQYFGGYVKRTLQLITPQEALHTVLQFQFLNWPDHGVPATTSSFFRLRRAVLDKHEELGNESPLLVHCSAGVGRTGTFIGYDMLMHESNQNACVDVFACVIEMRKQRVEMVQTSAQYELLHKLLLENYMFGESDISKDDLAKMQLQDGPDRERIEKEFQNLSAAEPLNDQVDNGDASWGEFGKVLIVRQPEDTEWISIDASPVEAFDNSHLLAAHGPLKSTSEYFWRAVLDNNVGTIVMLNEVDKESEDSQTCAIKYWPDSNVEPLEFNNVTVQMLDEELSGDVWTRNLLVSKKNQPQKKITHYQYLGWPSDGVPGNTAAIIDLALKMPSLDGVEKPGAVLIHCRDGLGRTGAFCTILNIIARMKIENHVDFFRAVKDLRDYRPGMVKTLEEYTFCYKVAQAYLETSNIYTEVSLDIDEQQIYEDVK